MGWRIAGLAGAAVATLAFLLPACCLAYVAGGAWARFAHTRGRRVVAAGLLPVTAGMMLAAGYLLVRDASTDWRSASLAIGVAAGTLATRRHPLWFLAATAGAGLVGIV